MSASASPNELLKRKQQERWSDFCREAQDRGIRVSATSESARALFKAFGFSEFVSAACIRHPDMAANLIESNALFASTHGIDPSGRLTPLLLQAVQDTHADGPVADLLPALMKALRTFRRAEMVRIAVRDLAGIADLDETMADLTALASASIDEALSLLYDRLCLTKGVPEDGAGRGQRLVVLGMGKLGAGELNFSSDVDLIFAYPAAGETRGGGKAVANHTFFTHLCRHLIQAIGEKTADGFVFRVDMRLRPYGDAGPLVMTFDQLEDYYQVQGREWERYALIKASVVAGDKAAGRTLLQRLRPFIYRRYLDFGAFESLREMKQKIAAEVLRKKLKVNIKLGRGGIREIEFFGQMFQLIRGGVVPALQRPAIQPVLKTLEKEGITPTVATAELLAAYRFLRATEHRLQEVKDQQTHNLPSNPVARYQLARAMGFGSWDAFRQELDRHRDRVRFHFDGLLASEGGDIQRENEETALRGLTEIWFGEADNEDRRQLFTQAGFGNGDTASAQLEAFKSEPSTRALSGIGKSRLDRLIPRVLKAAGACANAEVVLDRVLNLLKRIQQRVSYLALLLEYPDALNHLVRLFRVSPWIASLVSRHPVLLDELLDPRTLYAPPDLEMLRAGLDHQLASVPENDLEFQIEALCIFRQVNAFRVAASDITDVLPLMKVSDHLTWIAETILEKVVDIAWSHLVQKHGRPSCSLDGEACDRGFAVIGYGKLGGFELGYASDLDLVFLHAADPGETVGGKRPIDNAYFFSRLGQRVVHMLSTHTAAGSLYEPDMRLRPSGSAGLLVSHVNSFRQYQLKEAWTWEHQALIRARAITGDDALRKAFSTIRRHVLCQSRDHSRLRSAVREMREKMRENRLVAKNGLFDIKEDRGAIVDIEFLVQFWVLQHAADHPQIVRWTDNVRLLQSLAEAGILDEVTAYRLRRAYLIFRAVAHRLNLRERPPQVQKHRFGHLRDMVRFVWQESLGIDP